MLIVGLKIHLITFRKVKLVVRNPSAVQTPTRWSDRYVFLGPISTLEANEYIVRATKYKLDEVVANKLFLFRVQFVRYSR